MILESIAVIGFAILLDLVFGDPRNRYHPTAWIGNLIGIITTRMKNQNNSLEKIDAIFIVLIHVSISSIISFLSIPCDVTIPFDVTKPSDLLDLLIY